jgi:hypothetical protein
MPLWLVAKRFFAKRELFVSTGLPDIVDDAGAHQKIDADRYKRPPPGRTRFGCLLAKSTDPRRLNQRPIIDKYICLTYWWWLSRHFERTSVFTFSSD